MESLEDEEVLIETLRSLGEIIVVAGSCGVVALTIPFVSFCDSRRPRKDLGARDDLNAFAWVKGTEDRKLHAFA